MEHQVDAQGMVFICPQFTSPSEIWMLRQGRAVSARGGHILTKTLYEERLAPSDSDLRITVVPNELKALGKAHRYAHYVANWNRGFFRGTVSERRSLESFFDSNGITTALCHYGYSGIRFARLFKKLGIKTFVHFNGHDLSSSVRLPDYKKALVETLPLVSGFVTVADYMDEWLMENGVQRDRIRQIPYGAPVNEITVSDVVGSPDPTFVMVGRLTPKKMPRLAIRAFERCVSACSGARLVIIGDGPLHSECVALIEELGIQESVSLRGAQPNKVVREQLASSSVFMQHSATAENGDKEGWPVAVGEAMAAGLPVVSTNHASIPQQVDHGKTGFISEEGDWEAMGSNLITLANDPDLRLQMSKNALEKIGGLTSAGQAHKLVDFVIGKGTSA